MRAIKTTTMKGLMIRHTPAWRTLSLEEVAARCGLHPRLVKRFVTLGLIDPVDSEAKQFAPDVTLRLQRAMRLRHDLGLSYNGAALVLELLDRIEALERRLGQYERRAKFDG